MSGASLNNSRPLGPTEAPSVEDTGIDLNNESLNPLAERASTAIRHRGDSAWKADQVVKPTERVRVDRSTSAFGNTGEINTVTSDFRGINQVGEEEYQRILASMRSEGASDGEAYAVASDIRNRVTSDGGEEIDSAREALQKEQAPEALADLEADGLEEGVSAADVDRDAQTEAVGISEEEPLLNVEGDFEALEAALDNGIVLDLKVEQQFGVVEALKEGRVEELTAAANLEEGVELLVEQEIDSELARRIDEQFGEIQDIINRRQGALQREEALSGMEREQRALGPTEEEALTF